MSAELAARARAVQDAARAVVAECSFQYQGEESVEAMFDICLYPKGTPAALHAATEKLLSSGLYPDAGPAASFAEEARMFDAFVADVQKKHAGEDEYSYDYGRRSRSRGTLSHYQDLASAWNAMLPNQPYPRDPVPTRVDAGVVGDLQWERCGGLACVKRRP
jgi:hypothetical protein